ncbi:unnamed protein product [Didymodactylos carnosus]|uniref:Uncharacterized protein n=1 Tax=Didymodactylos carnosus TaxID=1234261 RepID=A0A8S2HSM4_9BILA|nr:unnamed protein product [Didymodactylos carnosus]CAF3677553.1 unnamed protein product [Didymodactylos carnosus]
MLRISNCSNNNSVLSLSIPLPYQGITIQITLGNIYTIGGLRIGLSASGSDNDSYTLQALNFHQPFSNVEKTLTQSPSVVIQITKVINETLPMVGEDSTYSGLWIPSFSVNLQNLFLSSNDYISSTLSETTLTIVMSETSYYIKNKQQPIAKQPEVIFHCLLFTIVCLEIFGLIFLIFKLLLLPLFNLLAHEVRPLTNRIGISYESSSESEDEEKAKKKKGKIAKKEEKESNDVLREHREIELSSTTDVVSFRSLEEHHEESKSTCRRTPLSVQNQLS